MFKDLSAVTGLPFLLDDMTYHSIFGSEVRLPLYDVRTDDEIRRVLLSENVDLPDIVYWMMRDLGLKDEPYRKETHSLRFDISYFVPAMFGPEYLKTSGHYHPAPKAGGPAYPEVYGVLHGKAIYLMQKVRNIGAGIGDVCVEDCIIVEGKPGDKVIMPPDYGHVTINPLPVPLAMSNWVSSDFSSQYDAVEEARGFAYYYVNDDGGPKWVRNHRYGDVPPLRRAIVREVPELGLRRDVALYEAGQEHPEALAWLNNPGAYKELIWSGLEIVGEVEVGEMYDSNA